MATKQERIREGIAKKLALYACENDWNKLSPFRKQIYLDQALVIMEYENSQNVVIKVERELPKLLSLAGEASIEEKSAFVLGVENLKEEMLKAGYVAVESLIKEEK